MVKYNWSRYISFTHLWIIDQKSLWNFKKACGFQRWQNDWAREESWDDLAARLHSNEWPNELLGGYSCIAIGPRCLGHLMSHTNSSDLAGVPKTWFLAKVIILNSQFPQIAKWQPYKLAQKPKYILESKHVGTEQRKNQPPMCKTDSWTARWTLSILDDFGRFWAEIISFSPLAPKLLQIESRGNVIKCSTCWALSPCRISRFSVQLFGSASSPFTEKSVFGWKSVCFIWHSGY